MKSKSLFLVILLLVGSLFMERSYGQLKVGGGLFYGTSLGNLGLDIRGSFRVIDNLYLTGLMDISFPDTFSGGSNFLNELGIYASYNVIQKDHVALYPLAGITLQHSMGITTHPLRASSAFKFGLTGGVGGKLAITDNLEAFGEATFTLGHFSQFKLTIGGLFNLWSLEKKSE